MITDTQKARIREEIGLFLLGEKITASTVDRLEIDRKVDRIVIVFRFEWDDEIVEGEAARPLREAACDIPASAFLNQPDPGRIILPLALPAVTARVRGQDTEHRVLSEGESHARKVEGLSSVSR